MSLRVSSAAAGRSPARAGAGIDFGRKTRACAPGGCGRARARWKSQLEPNAHAKHGRGVVGGDHFELSVGANVPLLRADTHEQVDAWIGRVVNLPVDHGRSGAGPPAVRAAAGKVIVKIHAEGRRVPGVRERMLEVGVSEPLLRAPDAEQSLGPEERVVVV